MLNNVDYDLFAKFIEIFYKQNFFVIKYFKNFNSNLFFNTHKTAKFIIIKMIENDKNKRTILLRPN